MASTGKPATRTRARPRSAPAKRKTAADGGILSPELARFFDAMASHFPGHVMQRVMRPDGSVRYTYVSPGLTALGLDPATILADVTSPQDWIHPDDATRWNAALVASAASLETLDEEVRIIADNGRVRWVRSIGNPRRLANGDVVWDGIALDVTDKREALDAIRLAKAEVERAEAQKARLLASLLAILAGPTRTLRETVSTGKGHGGNAELLASTAEAMERAVALLTGSEALADGAETPADDPRLAKLTKRQRDVLGLVGHGQSNRQIAHRLSLTEGTIKLHVAAILKALGVHNRTQAAAIALQAGLGASASAAEWGDGAS